MKKTEQAETIEAQHITVGDFVFNKHAHNAAWAWDRVVSSDEIASSGDIVITCAGGIQYWFHPREAVAVKRAK
jgi:hypothetical protein